MSASLADIRAAMLARLNTLLAAAPTPGPLASVTHFAGEVTREKGPSHNVLGAAPGAVLAFAGETFVPDAESLDLGELGFVGTSTWRVYVVARDLRANTDAASDATASGIDALVNAVVAALAGLDIAGLYRSSRLRPTKSAPFYMKPGTYVYACEFSARRWVDAVDATDTSTPLTEIHVGINEVGTPDTPPNPLDTLDFDPNA
jgi:hypothetical protein